MQTTRNRQSRGNSKFNKKKQPFRSRQNSSSKPRASHGRRFSGGRSGGNSRGSGNTRGGRKMPTFDPTKFINTNPVEVIEEKFVPEHTFKTFGLNERLVRNLVSAKLIIPTPIQDKIIPEILDGKDVIGLAETGTGKTAAFLLPLISKTLTDYGRQTLILTPTRELAIQIDAELKKLADHLKIYSTVCVGGTSIAPQIRGLRRQNHFIIGTPGRVLDLINRKNLDVRKLRTVVLDEADRMLDMGFIHDMRAILQNTPKDRETLFFSATINKDAEALVSEFLIKPVTISVKKKDVTNSIEQDVVKYHIGTKFETLKALFNDESFKRVIVFGAMKHSVEKLSKELVQNGIKAESIHGNKTHNARQRALKNFKSGNARVLVATDVAARGIHVDNVSHVINYDLPSTFDDYVHRIGRTGRGAEKGKALTFVNSHT